MRWPAGPVALLLSSVVAIQNDQQSVAVSRSFKNARSAYIFVKITDPKYGTTADLCADESICKHHATYTNLRTILNSHPSLHFQYSDAVDDNVLKLHIAKEGDSNVESLSSLIHTLNTNFAPLEFDYVTSTTEVNQPRIFVDESGTPLSKADLDGLRLTVSLKNGEEVEVKPEIIQEGGLLLTHGLVTAEDLSRKLSRKIRAASGPTIRIESIIQLLVVPNQFAEPARTTAQKQQHEKLIVDTLKLRALEVLKFLGLSSFNLINFKYDEHYNPWNKQFSDKARVTFDVVHQLALTNEQTKSNQFVERLPLAPTHSDPKKQLFKFVKHGTSSSVDLYNPCKSPFENDCDENAECIGVNNNKWFSLRQNVFGGKNQYAAFFTCKCKEGFMYHRKYTKRQTAMWYLEGSVCVENIYDAKHQNNIHSYILIGGWVMVGFYTVMMICLVGICCNTKALRLGHSGRYDVNR